MVKDYILSIIITVYNNEKYIEECLLPVLNQMKENHELIIVNDGSNDNSLNICEELTYGKNNVKIITQKNEGISSARNAGINNSRGKFIAFIDGDDWIEADSFRSLEKEFIKNPDLILLNTTKFFENSNRFILEKYSFEKMTANRDKNLKLLIDNKIYGRAWRFIISRKLLIRDNLFFHNGLIFEDEEWGIKAILSCRNIVYHNYTYYFYRKDISSITSKKDYDKYMQLLEIVKSTYSWCKNKKLNSMEQKYYRNALFRCIRNSFGNSYKFSESQKKKLLMWESSNEKCIRDILKVNWIIYKLSFFFSISKIMVIYKKYSKMKKFNRIKIKYIESKNKKSN